MSDKSSIENLFRKAASEVERSPMPSSPPPTADWSSMSSALKESTIIKAGGASKIAAIKALGAKITIKATAIAIIGTAAVTTTIVLTQEDETSQNVNPLNQKELIIADEVNKQIEENTLILDESLNIKTVNPSETEIPSKNQQLNPLVNKVAVEKTTSKSAPTVTKAPSSNIATNESRNNSTPSFIPEAGKEQTSNDERIRSRSNSNPVIETEVDEKIAANGNSPVNSAIGSLSEENTLDNIIPNVEQIDPTTNSTDGLLENENSISSTPFQGTQDITTEEQGESITSNVAIQTNDTSEISAPTVQKNSGFEVDSIAKLDVLIAADAPENILATSASERIAMERDKSKWLISPYFSVDLSDYKQEGISFINPFVSLGNEIDLNSGPLNLTTGLRVAYHIAPFLWIESGILFSQKNQITGRIGLLDENLLLNKVVDYNLSGKFLEVPINLMLKDNNGVFGWYAKAGLNLAFSYSESSNFVEIHDFETIKTFRIEPSIQSFIPVISIGAGIEYNLSRSIRLFVEPSFRYSVRPVLNTTEIDNIPINPKWSTLGLGFGINYYLK